MANYNYPVHHGISLEEGSAIENFVIESINDTAFVPTVVGQVWYSNVDEVYKASFENGTGGIEVMTFPTLAALQAAVARIAAIEGTYIKKDGSVAFTGNVDAGSNRVVNVATPVDLTDAANKGYVDGLFDSLGKAINYAGTIDASVVGGFDLDALPVAGRETGDYYKVTAAGTVKYLNTASQEVVISVLVGDGVVKNLDGGWDKFDNTNSEVRGTASFVAVTGSTDTGFVVDLDNTFKTRMSTAESDIGDTSTLTTVATDLSAAVNEVNAEADAIQAELDVTQAAAGLNADGTYTAKADANYISAVTTLKAADIQLDASLKSEETARIAGDAAIQAELDATQAGAGLAVDGTYTANALSNYIKTATSLKDADEKLDASLKSEETARIAGDAAIQAELDATQAAAGLNADGTYTANALSNYIKTATSLKDADEKLDASLKSEETARIAGDSALDTRVTTLESQVNGKIGELGNLLTTDKTNLVAAINEIQTEIGHTVENNLADLRTDVKTNIVNAINEVQDEVNAEVTRATAAETALGGRITQEVSDRQAADAALVTQLNSKQFKFESATAELIHVVTHNLGSTDLLITTQVQRPDGSWKNDVVSVEFTSSNAITVEMSAARKIRVAIIKITDYTAV